MARRTPAQLVLVSALAAAGLAVSSIPARADFHIMEIQEVFAGTTTEPMADFVELEMLAQGQNFVGTHTLHLYSAPDVYGEITRHDCTIPSDVPNGSTGARVLFATAEAQAVLPAPADFTIPGVLAGSGGAVCFANDCASWGSFSGSTIHPAGMPFPGGIPINQSINRVSDTNESSADFTPGPPNPMRNGVSNLGTMTCQGAPPGAAGGEVALKDFTARVKGGRATITGKIEPPASGEKVKLTFFANGSPLKKVAKKGATLNASSKFRKSFRVPSDSTRCRVKVAFKGAPVGKKTFRC